MKNVYVMEPKSQGQAKACVIWMHGLGANAQDMMGLIPQLPLIEPIRHVCIDAPIRPVTINNHIPMRAWYDIVGVELAAREDSVGILQSESFIRDVIEQQIAAGFKSKQIYLAGFSQGGAMALFTSLQTTLPLGGVIALSSYLPLAAQCKVNLNLETPIFIAHGTQDQIVLPAWTKQSAMFLQECGFKHVSMHQYHMTHAICAEEIHDLAHWLTKTLNLSTHSDGELE